MKMSSERHEGEISKDIRRTRQEKIEIQNLRRLPQIRKRSKKKKKKVSVCASYEKGVSGGVRKKVIQTGERGSWTWG